MAYQYYGKAVSALAPYGKSLLGGETQTMTDLTATDEDHSNAKDTYISS